MNFALILQATLPSLPITASDLGTIAQAITIQLNRDVAPIWGGSHVVRTSDGKDLQPGEVAFAIVNTLPDAPGAVAYHDVNGNGVPVAFEAVSMCSSIMSGSDSVSVAISHECIETIGDAACNLWADDGQGNEWARELCDAVESEWYSISVNAINVNVSDFLLPAFFDLNASGPYSFLNYAQKPFRTGPNGYQIKRTSGTGEQQVSATQLGIRRMHSRKREHWSSRAYRRGFRI